MRETEIEKYLVKEIEKLKGWALKFISPGHKGMPDRLVILPGGRIIFVELKATGKKLRSLQEYRKEQLLKLDCSVWSLDSKNKVDSFIGRLKFFQCLKERGGPLKK